MFCLPECGSQAGPGPAAVDAIAAAGGVVSGGVKLLEDGKRRVGRGRKGKGGVGVGSGGG